MSGADRRNMTPGITRAEVRRLWRRGRGKRPRDIAAALGISTQAVYQHIARLRRELGMVEQDDSRR